jgi:hypothetical protein
MRRKAQERNRTEEAEDVLESHLPFALLGTACDEGAMEVARTSESANCEPKQEFSHTGSNIQSHGF